MDIDKLNLELPSKLTDLCRFSFDFSNLMKIIEYLFNNNLVMIKEIKVLRTKVYDLEIHQSEIDKIKEKEILMEKSSENMNINFLNMKERFLQNQSKVDELIKKDEKYGRDLEKYSKIIEGHDTNINNLNRVVEENVKTIKQNHENIGINLERLNKMEQKIDEMNSENIKNKEIIETNINKNINEINNTGKDIETLNNSISEINETINSIKVLMDKKNREFDNSISNIMDNITELTTKGIKDETPEKESNDNNLFKIAMGEIERVNEKINTFNEEQKLIIEKKDKENEIFKRLLEGLQSDINNINNKIININGFQTISNEAENNDKVKIDSDNTKFASKKSQMKLDDNIKQLMKTISTLPNREEFETFQRNIISRIKKFEESGMGMMPFESKINRTQSSKEKSEPSVNYLNATFVENLRNSLYNDLGSNFKEIIKKEAKNLDLSKNAQILEILKIITKHNDDINNNNKSVIDLRKTLIAIDSDKRINILLEKITNLEEDEERNKKKILELNQIMNGFNDKDESEDGETNFEPTCVRGKIEITEKLINTMNDKINSVEAKYKSITKEIKDDIKSNLKLESIKTVNQFREKLEIFSRRFEEELRNKIDQMGLNNFEKRINSKFYYDLKDKLNRQEMQKNNNLINRKIDSLENKISKTLVDTIIDLQMDEAPLIVKKAPNNLEVCASCNQVIPKEIENKSIINNDLINQSNPNTNKSININKFMSNSTNNKFRKTFYGFNKTQTSMPKINNVMSLKKELPDINKYN